MTGADHQVSVEQGVTVVQLGNGYDAIDESNVEEMSQVLRGLAETADPAKLVIDLSKISFFASSFIEVLFRVWNRLNRRAGCFALCGVTEYCAEVLRVSKLDTLWDLYPDPPSAVEALKEPGEKTEGS